METFKKANKKLLRVNQEKFPGLIFLKLPVSGNTAYKALKGAYLINTILNYA